MTTTINASTSSGIVATADGSGILKVQSNGVTTNALAWVQFAGSSGTINAAYNVSSVTRNSTGVYTVNFTNALADANYAFQLTSSNIGGAAWGVGLDTNAPSTTALRFYTQAYSTSNFDPTYNCVTIFGN